MAQLDLSSLILPDIHKGYTEKYQYYIIAECEETDFMYGDFIYLPDFPKSAGMVTELIVMRCETDVLKLFEDNGRMVLIPQHDKQDYGVPIFTRETERYELQNWEIPENFFWSSAQANATLEYIKEKCGYVKGFNPEEFSIINPFRHFNNISEDLKKNKKGE